MFSINDLRPGVKIEIEGKIYEVLAAFHRKLGRGSGQMQTRLRNLADGSISERVFKGKVQITKAEVSIERAIFLYRTEVNLFFMKQSGFEQFSVPEERFGRKAAFLKKGMGVDLLNFNNRIIGVNLPIKIVLEVKEAGPNYKGDTVSTASKPVTLETGVKINVPIFIQPGDKIIVDTRTGQYVERVRE